ncbi:hypothetical protein ACMAZF_18140 [Psychrobium sp. nBUS_13]|uniref:hypothetical protein n=1 Tax=Psychrobium sp. nBUS_13 TaxID=3395319 RepID=UPI003EBE487F
MKMLDFIGNGYSGVVQMPHNEAAKAYSTPLISNLDIGSYKIELSDTNCIKYLPTCTC